MKKMYVFLLLSLWLCAACNDDDDGMPALSFSNDTYTLKADTPLEIVLNASEEVKGLTAVDFRVTGTAIEEEDYTLSDHQFVFLPATRTARIQITPKENYAPDRIIQLSLLATNGFEITEKASATIAVEARKSVVYSFTRDTTDLYDTRSVKIKVTDREGNPWNSEGDLHLPFTFSGSAQKGTHYAVEGNTNEFIIPAGKDEGTIVLNYIAQVPGNDQILISLNQNSGVHAGAYDQLSVRIVPPNILTDLRGTWIYNDQFLSLDLFSWWVNYPEDLVNLPDPMTSAGSIHFYSEDIDSLETNLTGDLSHYLRNCSLGFLEETDETLMEQDWLDAKVSWVRLGKANVNFSAAHSTERTALIGFRFSDESKNILEMRIVDYVPTDFLVLSYQDMLESLDEEWLGYPMKDFYPLVFLFRKQ